MFRYFIISILYGLCLLPFRTGHAEAPEQWFREGRSAVEQARALMRRPATGRARNLILFVGDGMGVSTVTAARILEGQLRGEAGEENLLSFETMPYVALSKTYNTNQQTPDSAGTMTAMMTGVKTRAGLISVNQNSLRADCASAGGQELETFLEQAEQAGRATGVVTTARLTHATPAATYAHSPERDWEDDRDLPEEAKQQGCRDIARQLIEFAHGDGIEVALGGGRRGFLPGDTPDPEYPDKTGERGDGRDLTGEWLERYDNAAYVWDRAGFAAVDPATTDHLLGLFEPSHMRYEQDRAEDVAGEPSLTEMTEKAIAILHRNPKGFFLMVEAGRVDHAHHAGNAFRALTDTIELSRAVAKARAMTDPRDTLIIVTADHSHVFTMAGYPTRGNPILGKVIGNDDHGRPQPEPKAALDGMPYTTLGYANGRGYASLETGGDDRYEHPAATGRVEDLTLVETEDEGYHQEALVPLEAETHGGEDVAVYAEGPGAWLLHGVLEQNVIYHVMEEAARLNRKPWWKRMPGRE